MRSDIRKIIQSESSFVRKDLNAYYRRTENARLYHVKRFKKCRYEIYVPLITNEYNGVPEFSSITIKNIAPHEEPKTIVVTAEKTDQKYHYKDKARFGEFVFLLAAKLKYDLLCEGFEYAKAGFLYSRELMRLYECKTTKVSPSILKTLTRFYKKLNEPIIRNLFFEQGQLWHLICYHGKAHPDPKGARYMYWLNVAAQDIHFVKENKQEIPENELIGLLARLFPPKYLIKTDEFAEFIDILQGERTKRIKTDKEASFVVRPDMIADNDTDCDIRNISKYCISFSDFIKDRIKGFKGRKIIFERINEFIKENECGYLIIQGDPGIGKSAILAMLVSQNDYIHHFNVRSSGKNKACDFLGNICARLITRYKLGYNSIPPEAITNGAFLAKLLNEISPKLSKKDKLVIAVDALDEVDISGSDPGANILYLPQVLLSNIIIVATTRRIESLPLRIDCLQKPIEIEPDSKENLCDIEQYIREKLEEYNLHSCIAGNNLTEEDFIEQLVAKSEGNFMYLKHVLPEIARVDGSYNKLDIDQLPVGLANYYKDHWRRMGMMDASLPHAKIKIMYVISEALAPITREIITLFSGEDDITVQLVLREWNEFFHKNMIDNTLHYSIYHNSFREFLNRQEIIQASGISIEGINDMIADRLFDEIDD